MGVIALEGMRFWAYHGVYEEEQVLGGEYLLDVYLTTHTNSAAGTDNIADTLNYETVYQICRLEMKKPSRLLEHLLSRILIRLKHTFQGLATVEVKVHKLNPPLGGRVEKASLKDSQSFAAKCGRCGKNMICYGDETCWCTEAKTMFPRTVEMVSTTHGSCVCKNCIGFLGG